MKCTGEAVELQHSIRGASDAARDHVWDLCPELRLRLGMLSVKLDECLIMGTLDHIRLENQSPPETNGFFPSLKHKGSQESHIGLQPSPERSLDGRVVQTCSNDGFSCWQWHTGNGVSVEGAHPQTSFDGVHFPHHTQPFRLCAVHSRISVGRGESHCAGSPLAVLFGTCVGGLLLGQFITVHCGLHI